MDGVRILFSGDTSIDVEFGTEIDYTINRKVQALCHLLESKPIYGVVEVVPTYRALTIHYLPEKILYHELREKVEAYIEKAGEEDNDTKEIVEIPVFYGGETGPDLSYVAEYNHLSEQEVIDIHTSGDYLIYMLGFTPGFTYLGGMDDRIATPRLPSPRQCISGGSVGIAGKQTGVYPINSPGGWRIIGSTPVKFFDPDNEKPILLKAGQHIKFVPVEKAEYDRIKKLADEKKYICKTYKK